jgi:cytochrome c biogenesis protein CcmG, thiol:disulfide interchange protein DsbE
MKMTNRNFGRWKKIWVLFVMLLVMGGCSNESSTGLTGKVAPDFTLTMLDKSTISLNTLKGKPVLLEFWAPWCSGCVKNIPPLKKLYSLYGDKITFLASSSERGEKTVGMFVTKEQIPYPVALSTQKILTDYQVSGIPLTVLIDGEGVVCYSHAGQFSYDLLEKKIKQAIVDQK